MGYVATVLTRPQVNILHCQRNVNQENLSLRMTPISNFAKLQTQSFREISSESLCVAVVRDSLCVGFGRELRPFLPNCLLQIFDVSNGKLNDRSLLIYETPIPETVHNLERGLSIPLKPIMLAGCSSYSTVIDLSEPFAKGKNISDADHYLMSENQSVHNSIDLNAMNVKQGKLPVNSSFCLSDLNPDVFHSSSNKNSPKRLVNNPNSALSSSPSLNMNNNFHHSSTLSNDFINSYTVQRNSQAWIDKLPEKTILVTLSVQKSSQQQIPSNNIQFNNNNTNNCVILGASPLSNSASPAGNPKHILAFSPAIPLSRSNSNLNNNINININSTISSPVHTPPRGTHSLIPRHSPGGAAFPQQQPVLAQNHVDNFSLNNGGNSNNTSSNFNNVMTQHSLSPINNQTKPLSNSESPISSPLLTTVRSPLTAPANPLALNSSRPNSSTIHTIMPCVSIKIGNPKLLLDGKKNHPHSSSLGSSPSGLTFQRGGGSSPQTGSTTKASLSMHPRVSPLPAHKPSHQKTTDTFFASKSDPPSTAAMTPARDKSRTTSPSRDNVLVDYPRASVQAVIHKNVLVVSWTLLDVKQLQCTDSWLWPAAKYQIRICLAETDNNMNQTPPSSPNTAKTPYSEKQRLQSPGIGLITLREIQPSLRPSNGLYASGSLVFPLTELPAYTKVSVGLWATPARKTSLSPPLAGHILLLNTSPCILAIGRTPVVVERPSLPPPDKDLSQKNKKDLENRAKLLHNKLAANTAAAKAASVKELESARKVDNRTIKDKAIEAETIHQEVHAVESRRHTLGGLLKVENKMLTAPVTNLLTGESIKINVSDTAQNPENDGTVIIHGEENLIQYKLSRSQNRTSTIHASAPLPDDDDDGYNTYNRFSQWDKNVSVRPFNPLEEPLSGAGGRRHTTAYEKRKEPNSNAEKNRFTLFVKPSNANDVDFNTDDLELENKKEFAPSPLAHGRKSFVAPSAASIAPTVFGGNSKNEIFTQKKSNFSTFDAVVNDDTNLALEREEEEEKRNFDQSTVNQSFAIKKNETGLYGNTFLSQKGELFGNTISSNNLSTFGTIPSKIVPKKFGSNLAQQQQQPNTTSNAVTNGGVLFNETVRSSKHPRLTNLETENEFIDAQSVRNRRSTAVSSANWAVPSSIGEESNAENMLRNSRTSGNALPRTSNLLSPTQDDLLEANNNNLDMDLTNQSSKMAISSRTFHFDGNNQQLNVNFNNTKQEEEETAFTPIPVASPPPPRPLMKKIPPSAPSANSIFANESSFPFASNSPSPIPLKKGPPPKKGAARAPPPRPNSNAVLASPDLTEAGDRIPATTVDNEKQQVKEDHSIPNVVLNGSTIQSEPVAITLNATPVISSEQTNEQMTLRKSRKSVFKPKLTEEEIDILNAERIAKASTLFNADGSLKLAFVDVDETLNGALPEVSKSVIIAQTADASIKVTRKSVFINEEENSFRDVQIADDSDHQKLEQKRQQDLKSKEAAIINLYDGESGRLAIPHLSRMSVAPPSIFAIESDPVLAVRKSLAASSLPPVIHANKIILVDSIDKDDAKKKKNFLETSNSDLRDTELNRSTSPFSMSSAPPKKIKPKRIPTEEEVLKKLERLSTIYDANGRLKMFGFSFTDPIDSGSGELNASLSKTSEIINSMGPVNEKKELIKSSDANIGDANDRKSNSSSTVSRLTGIPATAERTAINFNMSSASNLDNIATSSTALHDKKLSRLSKKNPHLSIKEIEKLEADRVEQKKQKIADLYSDGGFLFMPTDFIAPPTVMDSGFDINNLGDGSRSEKNIHNVHIIADDNLATEPINNSSFNKLTPPSPSYPFDPSVSGSNNNSKRRITFKAGLEEGPSGSSLINGTAGLNNSGSVVSSPKIL